jgi:nucleoside-diphosphate-sugar epimerase
VATVTEIVSAMREAAPPGRQRPEDLPLSELRSLTQALLAARPEAIEERERFDSVRQRCVPLDEAATRSWLAGKTVLVTGGTGCIGSTLLGEAVRLGAARLVSVSRGLTGGWPQHDAVEYLRADICDRAGLARVVGQVRPDVVFHVAAQRDPGLAEARVRLTVGTNIFGTQNVAEVCAAAGVGTVISATSGKALRPYSREVYTAAKRAAEWVLARTAAAATGTAIAAVRFTHVVDNSIVDDRLQSWARSGVIRLHDPNTLFYAQSALESVQLMLVAGLGAKAGRLQIYTINDLGMPISLLDLALGTLLQARSTSPIYLSGHDPGYEPVAFPGLYDPLTAGDISPLLNAFEAIVAEQDVRLGVDWTVSAVDLSQVPDDSLQKLAAACKDSPGQDAAAAGQAGAGQNGAGQNGAGQDAGEERVRAALDELSWQIYEATLAGVSQRALHRAALLTAPHVDRLSRDHARMLAAIRRRLGEGAPSPRATTATATGTATAAEPATAAAVATSG